MYKPEKSIARNIIIIEELKSELLTSVARLFKALLEKSEGLILESLSRIIIACFLLARRTGANFQRLEQAVEQKVRVSLQEKKEADPLRDDLKDLMHYYESLKH